MKTADCAMLDYGVQIELDRPVSELGYLGEATYKCMTRLGEHIRGTIDGPNPHCQDNPGLSIESHAHGFQELNYRGSRRTGLAVGDVIYRQIEESIKAGRYVVKRNL